MLKLISLALVIWSFFQPNIASIIFLAFVGILEGYLLFLNRYGRPPIKNTEKLTKIELEVLKKYHLYFWFPFTARALSTTLSLIQLFALILAPWLLYKKFWIQAILIGINYFPAALLSRLLNPGFYLHHDSKKRGNDIPSEEAFAFDSLCEIIKEYEIDDQNKIYAE